jgi:hypothetical protein
MKVYGWGSRGEGTFYRTIASNDPEIQTARQTKYAIIRPDSYAVNPKGEIEKFEGEIYYAKNYNDYNNNSYREKAVDAKKYPYSNFEDAIKEQQKITQKNISKLEGELSKDKSYTSLAEQIASISGGNQPGTTIGAASQVLPAGLSASSLDAISGGISQLASAQNPAITALSSGNNFATSPLANKLNFQVSDQQILDDYNATKVGRLNSIVQQGNTQVAGIQQRLTAAQSLLNQLPSGDPRYTSSKVYVDQLKSDLNSVTEAITGANKQIKEFKPIGVGTPEAASQITSFREYLQLPEERATEQLRQIDPESYQSAVALGQRYRQMATAPIGETKSAQAEQLRSNLEQEAINQLALGSQLGAEEQRQYQQAARAAQTARGNIFGVAPAVEEAVTTGLAGEQRKLARYGAATQFLASGQNTSDALKSDIAFRDALLQNRLGAASGFVAGGPSIYNLSQARTGQQQGAMQQYIQANQALPGGFNQQPSTAQPFYQAVDQGIPVALTNAFTNLYGSQANYLANTYGAQVGAISRQPSGFQNFATAAGGAFDLARGFGALGSAGLICWVAREVYGIDNPKWLQFREWMLTKASDNLRNYYIEYGERIAKSIRNKPKIKALIRKWMDSKIG